MKASDRYRLKILPAGRNDRVAEISDQEGNVLKYIFCRYRLGNEAGGLETQLRQDHQTMEAQAFAEKYEI